MSTERNFDTDPVRILSLDGGGTWAILQAIALQDIYSGTSVKTCRDILNQFDIIVANSGGSLILAALVENTDKDISEVINLFDSQENREKLFSPLRFGERSFVEWIVKFGKVGPRYKASRKIEGILSIMKKTGQLKMSELRDKTHIHPHLVICGFDYDMNSAFLFKTRQNDCAYRLSDAINASSNAPVNFFDEPVKFGVKNNWTSEHRYWDGAVGGNNNPVLIGITEALKTIDKLTCSDKHIKLLSIGTGGNLLPVSGHTNSDEERSSGLVQSMNKNTFFKDISKMATSILSEPPSAANYMAHVFLGGEPEEGKPHFVRMNALIQPILDSDNLWKIPDGIDPGSFNDLVKMEMDAVKQSDVDKIKKLGDWWIQDMVVNQSIRYDKGDFKTKIGHSKFSDAKKEWLKICGF